MSRAVRCDYCSELEERARLAWSANLPTRRDGRPGESFDFCSDECFRDFLVARIEIRAQRRAEREAAEATGRPTPTSVRVLHQAVDA